MTKKPTFQELLAAKKAQLAAASTPKEAPVEAPVEEPKPLSFLERLKAPATAPAPAPAPAVEEEAEAEPSRLPRVSISSEVIAASNAVAASTDALQEIEETASTAEIKERIARLTTLEGFDLKQAMDGLRSLILANPSACSLLLPEDVGDMVTALRKMTGNTKAAMMAAPKRGGRKAAAPAILNPSDLDALLGDLI